MNDLIGKKLFYNGANHLDVYLNFKCNLKCSHCFVGTELTRFESMDFNSVIVLLNYAVNNGAKQVTFLGGEPTLFKDLVKLIEIAYQIGFDKVKVVTNGLRPLRKILEFNYLNKKPIIVFSYDGYTQDTFENIRGVNTYKEINHNIKLALANKFKCAGIISVSKVNYYEVIQILEHLNSLAFESVNIHFVNSVGFANPNDCVSISDWVKLGKKIKELDLNMNVKWEERFRLKKEKSNDTCVIQDNKGGNIMVFPDGKVHMCAMFFGVNSMNSYKWDGKEIIDSTNTKNESSFVLKEKKNCSNCPGIKFINEGMEDERYDYLCMYKKVSI